jgi:hypothetical protein
MCGREEGSKYENLCGTPCQPVVNALLGYFRYTSCGKEKTYCFNDEAFDLMKTFNV